MLNGAGFNIFQNDALELHKLAFPDRPVPPLVDEEASDFRAENRSKWWFGAVFEAF